MGFKRNYQIKCSFKQLKYFFTSHSDNRLNPQFITGINDTEDIFTILINKNPKHKLGW